jgi:hypothetical protein
MLSRYSVWKEKLLSRGDETMQDLWERTLGDPAWEGKTISDFTREFRTLDPVDFIGKLAQPIMLAGGSLDEDYFISEQQEELLRLTTSKRVVFLKVQGEPHRFRHWSPSFRIVASLFTAWFAESL